MPPSAPRRVEIDGASLAYSDTGAGAPILFVHGYFLSRRTWRKVIPGLAASHRCIALDLLGAGETDVADDADVSVPAQVRMLSAFLDALELPRVTLVAHDSGAVLTRALAVQRPEHVAGLVLSDTEIPGHRVRSAIAFQRILRLPGAERAFERMLVSRAAWSQILSRAAIFDRRGFDVREFVDTHLAPLAASRARRRASRRFAAQWDLGAVDRVPHDQLRMRKLILWGDHDGFIPLPRVRSFYDTLPAPKELAWIPRCGTLPHEERPQAWLEAVHPFLAGVDPAHA